MPIEIDLGAGPHWLKDTVKEHNRQKLVKRQAVLMQKSQQRMKFRAAVESKQKRGGSDAKDS